MQILDMILSYINSAMGQASIIAIVLEFVLRMIPSPQPLGILHIIGAAAKKIGAIFSAVGALLDRVLPQKLSDPKL